MIIIYKRKTASSEECRDDHNGGVNRFINIFKCFESSYNSDNDDDCISDPEEDRVLNCLIGMIRIERELFIRVDQRAWW
jgi:hypothetical protein